MNHVLTRSDRAPLNFNSPDSRDMSTQRAKLTVSGLHLQRLKALKCGMLQEICGIAKRRNTSYTVVARKMFKMGADATRTEVLARLNREIEDFSI